jgi:hypothetical protein
VTNQPQLEWVVEEEEAHHLHRHHHQYHHLLVLFYGKMTTNRYHDTLEVACNDDATYHDQAYDLLHHNQYHHLHHLHRFHLVVVEVGHPMT